MFTFKFLSQVSTRFSQIGQNQNLKKYDFVMPFYFNKSYTKSICWLAVLKYKLQLHILFGLFKEIVLSTFQYIQIYTLFANSEDKEIHFIQYLLIFLT